MSERENSSSGNTKESSQQGKNKSNNDNQDLTIDTEKLTNTLSRLLKGQPCVEDLTSFFAPFISGNKNGSQQMTSGNGNRTCNKENQGDKSKDGKEAGTRDNEGKMAKDKNKRSKSVDNEKDAKRKCQENLGKLNNPGELMSCKFCHDLIRLESYNDHIKEKHSSLFFKKVNSDNRDVGVAENKNNAKKVDAWRATFTPESAPAILMYICKTCKLATAVFDNAVEHAQNHILNLEFETKLCEICNLKFAADFNMHRELHSNDDDIDRDSFKYVLYDYMDLMSHKWLDIFDIKSMADKVKSASIYFSTRFIRLRLQNDSKDASEKNTLFKCVTCKKYVDPHSVELHVQQQNNCFKELRSYSCSKCDRPFVTEKAKDEHSLTHEEPNANEEFRTVLFSDQNDLIFNKKLLEVGGKIFIADNESRKSNEGDGNGIQNELDKASKHDTVTDKDMDNQKITDIYECQCGLCFDRLQYLWSHLKNCSSAIKVGTKTCKCGLVFDEQNYDYHCEVHRNGFTTFNVKGLSIQDKKSIDVRGISGEFRNEVQT